MVMRLFDKFTNVMKTVAGFVDGSNKLSPLEKEEFNKKLEYLVNQEINVLVVGGTGVGKSSTINALFKMEGAVENSQAKVGTGPDAETQTLSVYNVGNLKIWDTPGVGESKLADIRHVNAINQKLREKDKNGELLIDLILVLLDGGARDYGSIFTLLERLSHQTKEQTRLVIGINRIDMVAKGRGWDDANRCPTPALEKVIEEKRASIARRFKNEFKIEKKPVAYCAGFSDEFGSREAYNIPELLCEIVSAIQPKKRVAVMEKARSRVIHQATPVQKQKIVEKVKESDSGFFKTIVKVGLGAMFGGFFGGCYVTTAVCEYRNKPDNCHMLYSFRKFRDSWLAKQPGGLALIGEYYDIAPDIVSWIDQRNNRDEIYECLYIDYLKPCYRLIKKKRYDECKTRYIEMVRMLEKLKAISH